MEFTLETGDEHAVVDCNGELIAVDSVYSDQGDSIVVPAKMITEYLDDPDSLAKKIIDKMRHTPDVVRCTQEAKKKMPRQMWIDESMFGLDWTPISKELVGFLMAFEGPEGHISFDIHSRPPRNNLAGDLYLPVGWCGFFGDGEVSSYGVWKAVDSDGGSFLIERVTDRKLIEIFFNEIKHPELMQHIDALVEKWVLN